MTYLAYLEPKTTYKTRVYSSKSFMEAIRFYDFYNGSWPVKEGDEWVVNI